MSLSIADAKVDTFYKLTKHSWNFFARFFNTKSQKADLQELSNTKNLQKCTQIGIYMLQNIKNSSNNKGQCNTPAPQLVLYYNMYIS